MKKLLALLVLALFAAGWASATDSPMYAKVVPVTRVISDQKGYQVTYLTNHGDPKVIYIPLQWFYQIGDYKTSDGFIRGEIVRSNGESYPFMQIFWKDGKFHHLRLFVVDNYGDRSWGVHPDADWSSKFDPAKMPDFQFE